MVTNSLVEVPFSVHGLIFIESVRGPLPNWAMYKRTVYLVFGKKIFGLWKREKIPSNERGPKSQLKKST